MSAIQLSPLASITTGFLMLFVGKRLNREWNFLQRYSIPEPVSGGLLVALLLTVLHVVGGPMNAIEGLSAEDSSWSQVAASGTITGLRHRSIHCSKN